VSGCIALFCGGVGGAKMAAGFAATLAASDLQIIVNVGDDFEFCGLNISPDLDTVMYTLADRHDAEKGWGLRGETWTTMQRLIELGGPSWFQLGDQDIATHLWRTSLLRQGQSLSDVTHTLSRAHGIAHSIVPATDERLRTQIRTGDGLLDFQDYFVRLRAQPVALEILYAGAEHARPSPALRDCLAHPSLRAIVLAPSNPWLSLGPMLAIPGVKETLGRRGLPVIAVSPIIAGKAVKGPAAKLLGELGAEITVYGVAQFYRNVATHFVIDQQDAMHADRIRALGMKVHCTDILIPSPARQRSLAEELLDMLDRLETASFGA